MSYTINGCILKNSHDVDLFDIFTSRMENARSIIKKL